MVTVLERVRLHGHLDSKVDDHKDPLLEKDASGHPSLMSSPPPYQPNDHLGPYLRLSHRLSLAPFAYPIIAVAFVALRFYLSLQSARNLIQDAKELVIATCLGAQRAATAAVSFPRWMALETNEQLIHVAVDTLDASRNGLNLRSVFCDFHMTRH